MLFATTCTCSVSFLSVIERKVILVYDTRFVFSYFSYLESIMMHETRVGALIRYRSLGEEQRKQRCMEKGEGLLLPS